MPNYLEFRSSRPAYNQMKYGALQTARGLSSESIRASGSRLAARGMGDVPGVSADIAARQNRAMMGALTPQFAQLDRESIQMDEQRRQRAEALAYAERMRKIAKKDAEKNFWGQMAINLAALAVTAGTGGAAAPIIAGLGAGALGAGIYGATR